MTSLDGWITSKVVDTASKMRAGGTPSRSNPNYWRGDIPFVLIEDMTKTDRFLFETKENISNLGLQSSSTWIVPENSILLSMYATLGKVVINKIPVATNQAILGIIPGKVDRDFLFYLLQYSADRLSKLNSQTTQKNLNKQIVSDFEIMYPSDPAEQRAIADILSTLDEAVAQSESLVRKYQSIKQGLMSDLLTRGVGENGELRPSYEEAPGLYQLTELGYIPAQWIAGNLGNFCELHNNLRKPISALVRENMKGEYPYYGPTGILDYLNEFRVEGEFVLIGEDGDHFLKFMNWSMTQWVKGKFNVNNHAHIMKGRNGCSTEWLHRFFSHRDITLSLTRQGAGRFKLNKASLLNLGIAVPKPEEQKRICEIISAMEMNIQNSIDYLAKLNDLKQGLMQDLLSGQVRVKVT